MYIRVGANLQGQVKILYIIKERKRICGLSESLIYQGDAFYLVEEQCVSKSYSTNNY